MDPDRIRDCTVILLDTNALFFPFTHGIDLESAISEIISSGADIRVPTPALRELEDLINRKEKHATSAKTYAQRFEVLTYPGKGDRTIIEMAEKLEAAVVTADRELRIKLNEKGITVIGPRGKGRLMIYGSDDV